MDYIYIVKEMPDQEINERIKNAYKRIEQYLEEQKNKAVESGIPIVVAEQKEFKVIKNRELSNKSIPITIDHVKESIDICNSVESETNF